MRPALLGAAAWLSASAPALAHEVGVSTAAVGVVKREVTAELAFAGLELAAWSPAALADDVRVSSAGETCPPAGSELRPLEGDGLQLVVRFRCPEPPASLSYRLPLLQRLGHGHRHLVTVRAGELEQSAVLHRGQPAFTMALAASRAPGSGRGADLPEGGESAEPGAAFYRLLVMGVEHILTGWDHLVFLLGLLLVGGRLPSLLKTVTAFTAGHSVTLACGALGLYSPGPRWVEPLIALSIAYLGFENLFFPQVERRWRIALAFGLIHGFGFSAALSELALPRAEMVRALLAFNLGVEIGQLAVLALVVPLLVLARRWSLFSTHVAPALGGGIIVPGLVWFALRLGAR
jgi:hypothetical protein